MKIALRPDPDFLDLAAWQQRLAGLRTEPEDLVGRDIAIAHAESMVALLGGASQAGAPETI